MDADEFFDFKREELPHVREWIGREGAPGGPLQQLLAAFDYLERLQDTTTPRIPLAKVTEQPHTSREDCACHYCRTDRALGIPVCPVSSGSAVLREVD